MASSAAKPSSEGPSKAIKKTKKTRTSEHGMSPQKLAELSRPVCGDPYRDQFIARERKYWKSKRSEGKGPTPDIEALVRYKLSIDVHYVGLLKEKDQPKFNDRTQGSWRRASGLR